MCVLQLSKIFDDLNFDAVCGVNIPPTSFISCPVHSSKLNDVQSARAKNKTRSCEWFQIAYQMELEAAPLPPFHYHFLILRSVLILPDAE